jgi:hypothetical protein
MGQKAHNNPNTGSYCKDYMIVLKEKILKREIFATREVVDPIRNNNNIAFDQMDLQLQLKLLEYLDEVSALNSDFKDLKSQFIVEEKANVNIESFKRYIRRAKSGFYLDKAKKSFYIRSLLIIPQVLFFLIFLFLMFATTDSIEKVYIIKFCSRGFVLIADIIFFFCEYHALNKLQRIKPNNIFIFLIIVLQLTKFTSMVIIFVIDFVRNNCETSLDNKYLFLLNNIMIVKIENVCDLIKFLI